MQTSSGKRLSNAWSQEEASIGFYARNNCLVLIVYVVMKLTISSLLLFGRGVHYNPYLKIHRAEMCEGFGEGKTFLTTANKPITGSIPTFVHLEKVASELI